MDQNKSTKGQQGHGQPNQGRQGERNRSGSGGISNRGMSSSDEQEDLPSRGSSSDGSDRQSER